MTTLALLFWNIALWVVFVALTCDGVLPVTIGTVVSWWLFSNLAGVTIVRTFRVWRVGQHRRTSREQRETR